MVASIKLPNSKATCNVTNNTAPNSAAVPPAPKPEPPPLFDATPGKTRDCLVVIYDLENFTGFLGVPDIQRDAGLYLDFIDQQVRKAIIGGTRLWMDPVLHLHALEQLNILQDKFLGDGAMYIIDAQQVDYTQDEHQVELLCNRLWNLKQNFQRINQSAMEFMPVFDVPTRIRFGITYGQTIELRRADGGKEFIGFPINLAARLQKYAGTASLLVSSRLPFISNWAPRNKFVKVRAKALRGRPNEAVWIDPSDLAKTRKTDGEEDLFEKLAK